MKEAGLDVTSLAKAMGLTYQAVKRVIDGKSAAFTTPNNSVAAQILGVSTDWLATGDGARQRQAGDWPFSVARSDYEKLADDDREALDKTVAAFVSGTLARYELDEIKRKSGATQRNEVKPSRATMDALNESIEAMDQIARGSHRHAAAHPTRKQGGGSR